METESQLLLIKSIGIRVNSTKFCLDHLQFIHMLHARLSNQYRARNIRSNLTIVREKAQELEHLFKPIKQLQQYLIKARIIFSTPRKIA